MRIGCFLLFAVLLLAGNTGADFDQSSSCPGIRVKIHNIRNSNGTIACALFDSPDGFPIEFLRHAAGIMAIEIRDKEAYSDFAGIPPGTYALAVIHDENRNGKLDTNCLGVPKEGYGFSNNPGTFLSAPSFSAATFTYDGQALDLTITLHY